jgi:peptide/nickel transport system substrate-binding protein
MKSRKHLRARQPRQTPSISLQWLRRIVVVMIAGAAVIGGWVGVSAAARTASAKPTLTVGLNTAGTNLNPADSGDDPEPIISALSNEPITILEPNGKVGPGLATSWHYVGAGNRRFDFTLRPNARFSDGSPVTAQAVKAWLQYFVKAAGPFSGDIAFTSIETIGTHTVDLHLAQPNPEVPWLLSGVFNIGDVSSPRSLADASKLASTTDGAGPYVVVPSQTVANDHYTYVPNRYYYDKAAIKYSKVVVKIIPQASTMLEAVEAGQVDVAEGDISTAAAAKAAGVHALTATSGWVGMLFLDRSGATAPALAIPAVRQALNYAVNRKAITKGLLGTYGTPTSEANSADAPKPDPALVNYYPYNPAKAKSLLAAAGYPNGFTLSAVCPSYQGVYGCPVTQAIAQDLAAVGVKLNITTDPNNAQHIENIINGKYSTSAFIETPLEPEYEFYVTTLGPQAVLNEHHWNDATLVGLWGKSSAAAEPATYWKQMAERGVTQAYNLPIATTDTFWYVAKDVGGVVFSGGSLPLPTEWHPK